MVPYMDNKTVKFHPINMPHITFSKVEIVGFVTSAREDSKFYRYTVEDGTGTISVRYRKEAYVEHYQYRKKIDYKYKMYAASIHKHLHKFNRNCPKHFLKNRPGFDYPNDTSLNHMLVLEHSWWKAVNQGLLGKKPARLDYVHAVGYLRFDFSVNGGTREEFKFEDLSMGTIYFYATNLTCIHEKTYNKKLLNWLHSYIPNRYNSEDIHPKTQTF